MWGVFCRVVIVCLIFVVSVWSCVLDFLFVVVILCFFVILCNFLFSSRCSLSGGVFFVCFFNAVAGLFLVDFVVML